MGTKEAPHERPMPYWCRDCQRYFSVRTGSSIGGSPLPLRKSVFAMFLYVSRPKGISSVQLAKDLGVRQKTAWFMLMRLRTAWDQAGIPQFKGPMETDETFVGGRERNKHAKKKLRAGRGAVGKAIVLGARDPHTGRVWANTIPSTKRKVLQRFIQDHAARGAVVYTDSSSSYRGIPFHHESVHQSRGEYVRGEAHTNGIESLWAIVKRSYMGTYHYMSQKHLDRHLDEFTGRNNTRGQATVNRMSGVVNGMDGRRLTYRELIK